MRRHVAAAILLGAAVCLFPATRAHAQTSPPAPAPAQAEPQTREAALRSLREQKAARLTPYAAGGLEKAIAKVENERLLEDWLSVGPGGRYYVKFGGVTTGAGIAAGPGFRLRRLANGLLDFNAFAVVSYRRYLLAEASLSAPRLAGNRARLGVLGRRRYFPQEDFFGIGPEALRPLRVSYTYEENAFGAYAGTRVGRFLDVEARAEYLDPAVGEGKDSRIPTIGELFSDATAPGLATQPEFLVTRLSTDFDYGSPAGNPRRGGRYQAAISRYVDRGGGLYSFNRFDVDLRQYVPFLQERRVLALRALASFSGADSGAQVPFYYQRSLGGSDTLRGFRDFRFRDRNLLLLQAEYRWEIFPALDAALFYDAGKVAPEAEDLRIGDFESDYGFGFRFGTNRGVFLRIDAAFGSRDGKRYFIKWSRSF